MEITRFAVDPEERVTMWMQDLPVEADKNNTGVYIKGVPMDVTSVELVAQIIRFFAGNAPGPGKITVRVTMGDGNRVTAESAEDYDKPKPDEGGKDSPKVNSVSPSYASPGTQVTLQGTNLQNVRSVSLMLVIDGKHYSYTITQVRHPDDMRAQFNLPDNIAPGRYPIVVTDKTDGARRNTNRFIEVEG